MQAQPQISNGDHNGDHIQVPNTIRLEGQVEVVLSSKVQSSLSFFTPHNHQQHYVGYDKNVQIYIPIKSKVQLDLQNQKLSLEIEPLEPKEETDIVHYSTVPYLQNQKLSLEIEPLEPKEETDIVHYSTVPYVAQQDVLELDPVSESDKYEIVQDDDLDKMEVTFGKQHTGMEFSFEYESDEPLHLRRWLHEQLHSDDLVSSLLLSPNYDDDLVYTNLNITYNGHQSSARRVEIKLNYESEEYDEKERPEKQINWSQLPHEQQQRSKHWLEVAASKIRSADVDVIDAEVEFKGDEKFHYIAAAASANSPVDKKSRVLAYLERKSSSSQAKPYKVTFVHPVFSVYERVLGELHQNQVYWPFCTIDKQAISTFDNVTYDAELSQDWSVVFHYVPEYAKHQDISPQQQRQQMQVEEHVVLARGKQQKEIKITARAPETKAKLVEIDLKPSQSGAPKVLVNQQEQKYDQKQPETKAKLVEIDLKPSQSGAPKVLVNQQEQKYDQKQAAHSQDGYIQIYELPNQEVKVEIGDDYYVIYDGERAKITVVDDKFNDALRGLCGTFDGDDSTDFTAPENCILSEPEDFIESYTLNGKQPPSNRKCVPEEQRYVSVVSPRDLGDTQRRSSKSQNSREKGSSGCTKHQTQYQEDGNQVCFSTHPLPTCKSSCRAKSTTSKSVPVHCIEKNNVAELWMKQIDKGANPDFSLKTAHRNIQLFEQLFWCFKCYTLNGKQPPSNRKCVPEEQRYVSVVSPRDLGERSRSSKSQNSREKGSSGCTKHQTQYQEDGNQVCFSTHPLPTCKSSCRAKSTTSKSVPVHCIEKNNVAELWMKQIDKGANPDFSLKTAHRNIQYEVPQRCE
ncbi:von Willebrand factor type D domain [Popillia japonica]|uniref:von Willebrand factor type D domain n=1 Tax=Popillia japonica TaxID=7064 RepID=A0AAW1L5T8_POPJA